MDVEEKVVVRLLECLSDGVKLAFVAAGVIGLRLARHRTYEVGVDSHREAHHIYRLDDVCRPVASLLIRLDFVDDHVVLLFAVG